MELNRKTLKCIKELALAMTCREDNVPLTPVHINAFHALASAADYLHAIMARAELLELPLSVPSGQRVRYMRRPQPRESVTTGEVPDYPIQSPIIPQAGKGGDIVYKTILPPQSDEWQHEKCGTCRFARGGVCYFGPPTNTPSGRSFYPGVGLEDHACSHWQAKGNDDDA